VGGTLQDDDRPTTTARRCPMETPALRIGAVARRTGVAVATLRAWEARYGVLRPSRTEAAAAPTFQP